MCGIVASLDYTGTTRLETVTAMTSALTHRGPDGASSWQSPDHLASLGHTRLAVIDLNTGDQPIHSADGRYTIVLNGEIYNYQELKTQLIECGHQFNTASDTEVLLATWREWGTAGLSRLRGMFAFAIYDQAERNLFVARDRTGIKPLYLYRGNGGQRIVVASEIKAILTDSNIPRSLHAPAVADLLTLSYCQQPATFYQDICEVEPGTWHLFTQQGEHTEHFWQWQETPETFTAEEAIAATRSNLIASLSDHLVADVSIGAFLSSGIDSSLICAIASRELGHELNTYTVGFESAKYDESSAAKEIATALGTRHHTLKVSPDELNLELLYTVINQFDQPFGDSSAIPVYLLSKIISQHVKVVLSGDGGDEMFGGYPRFRHADLTHRASQYLGPLASLGSPLANIAGQLKPRWGRVARRIANATQQKQAGRLTWFASHVLPTEFDQTVSPELLAKLNTYRSELGRGAVATQPNGDDYMHVTIDDVLPSDYLKKMDVASSAHGLEVRVPYLGNQVIDLSAKLPKNMKYQGRQTKWILKKLLSSYLPKELYERPKAGFNIPLMRVLSSEDRRAAAARLTSSPELAALVTPAYIREISDAFSTLQWDNRKHSEYMVYQRFYALLSLVVWIDHHQPKLSL